ncbi:muramidase family protein [Paenibacillus sp. FSL K6-2524]|uniref:muramidase family protein n=1 Tax=Paenibacillus sp. FSL K6-2524 TaxID=2954516 RepID=UPI0030F56176
MKIHIVKTGDTLFDLSKKYNVPLQKLIDANPQLSNPNELSVGMKIKIPSEAISIGGNKYVVKTGDSLWKIAKAWGIPLQALINANPQISDPNVLKVGEIVNIPSSSSSGQGGPSNQQPGGTSKPGNPGKKNTGVKPENVKSENIKPENVKPENIKPEVKPEAVKPEAIKPAPIKPEAIKPAPIKPENLKPAPIKPENIMPENIKPIPIMFEQLKTQELPCFPEPHYPEFMSPQNYQMEQQPMTLPAPLYPSSCGCSDFGMQPNNNLFQQYQTQAGNVSSFYDFPQTPQENSFMGQHCGNEGYPGIHSTPFYPVPGMMEPYWPAGYPFQSNSVQNPYDSNNQPMPNASPNQGYWPSNQMPSSCCGPQPYYQSPYACCEPVHPHMYAQPSSLGYGGVGGWGQANVQNMPMSNVGGANQMKGNYEIDRQKVELGQTSVEQNETGKTLPKSKAKKQVKISANTPSKKSSKKETSTSGNAGAKKDRVSRNGRASGNRNPWINE